MSLRSIGIAWRSSLGFGLVALLLVGLGLFSLAQLSKMDSSTREINGNWMPSIISLAEMNQSILRQRIFTLRLVINTEATATAKNKATIAELASRTEELAASYERLVVDPVDRSLFEAFQRAYAAYSNDQNRVIALTAEGRIDEAREYITTTLSSNADALVKTLIALGDFNRKGADTAAQVSAETYSGAKLGVIVALVFAGLLTTLLAWLLTRSIVQPLAEAVQVAEVVASGNLTRSIDVRGNDEPARLLAALKGMQESLRKTIHSISDSSNQLASAAEELNTVTEDSTRGLHQQNHEIEQAATAVNEMTAAVDEVARNAVATAEASHDSEKAGLEGREQVLRTVQSIDHLAEDVTVTAGQVEQLADKVRDISKVLDVIRSIAEQTNLLALNAAIEAARAGDAGRGFAVVADEVRALAHRTQQSTQEIEQMIGGVQQGTNQAVNAMQNSNSRARTTLDIARAAGEALERIARSTATITERNLVVASASEEQAQVAREVDRNLVNIRDLSLQTSAGANQTSAASQELARLAIDLNTLISRFTV